MSKVKFAERKVVCFGYEFSFNCNNDQEECRENSLFCDSDSIFFSLFYILK